MAVRQKKPAGATAPVAQVRTKVAPASAPVAEKPLAAATLVAAVTDKTPPAVAPVQAPARKRLSKAFSRPLDKKLRQPAVVRERYTLPANEYEVLVALKQRLAGEGIKVKKSELLRAGLLLLPGLDREALLSLLAKVPPAG